LAAIARNGTRPPEGAGVGGEKQPDGEPFFRAAGQIDYLNLSPAFLIKMVPDVAKTFAARSPLIVIEMPRNVD
jgi:hypothetical protein